VAGCPFDLDGYAEPVRREVLSYPQLSTQLGFDGEVEVSTRTDGTVRFTGGSGSYLDPRTYSFRVGGTATVAGGTIQFTPSS
jgi:hypothetical protein